MDLTTEYGKELSRLFNEKDEIYSLQTFELRIKVLMALASQLEPIVTPHTEHFEQWLNKYYVSDGTHYCYKTRSGHKLFTLKELYKKYERAMKSPIVSG